MPPADISTGALIDPLVDALNGVQQISPQANPQFTSNEGRYAWDVAEGCWFVMAEAKGYRRVVSPVVGVPQAVTDLDLKMVPGMDIYLPIVRR